MSDKTVLLDVEETMLRYDAAVALRKLADDLAQGTLPSAEGGVAVGETLKVEMKGKVKPKDAGVKGSLKVELSWRT
ncbi:hypothetical protein NNJEOMEG_03998 [Fundidesulfovibrio magnetotacticus]|uniref:Amphi-Trp domain-containing protein n=1 Tax=Fundidesulfovibrio magnetotacticus TaxID=2730080 RepID=A0A6V8LUQ1_9BACT|nr:amphi-Trp domain-containing protein [Fundidesulfovibrio magnetotacticus]GFK96123.1 hypothetical protein NNJEOMEG_03998 [Fundidesulfovibrio magnetotacticus]